MSRFCELLKRIDVNSLLTLTSGVACKIKLIIISFELRRRTKTMRMQKRRLQEYF